MIARIGPAARASNLGIPGGVLAGDSALSLDGTGAVRLDEQALVVRARQGDSQAFGQLYQRYVERVYSFVVFRVGDQALAEDLTQEVFLQSLRALDSFDWRGSLAPWLLRIARNTVIDHWRRATRRPERNMTSLEPPESDGEDDALDRLVAVPDDADHRAEQVLHRAAIVEAAAHLTDLQQQVVALRFASGLSIKDTAEVMGRSEGAVKNLQHHALKALKKHLPIPTDD
jgi:RNA polymerase sigma-70 factor (ECF subfamily)